jgi:hypothetical protein
MMRFHAKGWHAANAYHAKPHRTPVKPKKPYADQFIN